MSEQLTAEMIEAIETTAAKTLKMFGRDNAAREKAFLQAKIDAGHKASEMMQIRVDAYTRLGI